MSVESKRGRTPGLNRERGEKAATTATRTIVTGVVVVDVSDTTVRTPSHVVRGRLWDALATATPGTQVRLVVGMRDYVDPTVVSYLLEEFHELCVEVDGTAQAVRPWVRALRQDPGPEWWELDTTPNCGEVF